MSIFNELDHRLSVVKRWPILHTIQQQSVAEHCHNVVRISKRIAVEWFDIDDPEDLLDIIEYAHHHDDFESLMGDPPTMIKPYIDEAAFEREHAHLIKKYTPASHAWTHHIVKIADKLEGYHFLCIEMALGNQYAKAHFDQEPNNILKYVRETFHDPWQDKLIPLLSAEMESMRNERSTRWSMRGR